MKPFSFYGVASFAAVLLAGALVLLVVHRVAIVDVTALAQRSNLALAQTALNLVKKDVADLLEAMHSATVATTQVPRLPAALDSALNELMRNPAVVRVKIYNRDGLVLFSTKLDQIGQMQHDNHAFDAVMKGKVVSGLAYRNAINPFDRHGEEHDLMQTYLPVQRSATEPILGALEIYTDARNVVRRNARAQRDVLAGVALILTLLYLALLLAARHGIKAAGAQQRAVQARIETLERLSAQLLSAEEEARRSIAIELHEELAQTLCGIKARLEQAQLEAPIQRVIDDMRTLASRLRPASLDQLGLLAAVRGFCDGYEKRHPDIRLDLRLDLDEDDVPPPLKIVVYRVTESALENIAHRPGGGRIELDLRRAGDAVGLAVAHRPREPGYLAAMLRHDGEYALSLAKIEEQVRLSGGSFAVRSSAMLGATMCASWPGVTAAPSTLGLEAKGRADRWAREADVLQ